MHMAIAITLSLMVGVTFGVIIMSIMNAARDD